VGAYSSRPGASDIPVVEEKRRLTLALRVLRREFPDCCISVDTFRAEIAQFVTEEFGVNIINDISAGLADDQMFKVVSSLRIAYIIMHMQGNPQTMQKNPVYGDLINELIVFFAERIASAREHGITDIIIDPGFGFGKTVSHNYQLLRGFNLFNILEVPVMAGVSRKGMIYRPLGITPAEAMNGTTVLNTLALDNGACMLRVHDVKEAVEAVKLFTIYRNAGNIM
jgi:dihydropteroate synthase